MIAVAGVMFTSAVAIYNRVKQHTFDLIIKTRFDELFKKNSNLVRLNFSNYDEVPSDIALNIYNSTDEVLIEVRNAVADVLNFYEILAISVWYRDANEEILKDYYKDFIVEHVGILKNFIPIWRTKNPNAFEYIVWLYNEWGESPLVLNIQNGNKAK